MGAALRPAFSQDTPSDIIAKACQVRRKIEFSIVAFFKLKDTLEFTPKKERKGKYLFLSWKYNSDSSFFYSVSNDDVVTVNCIPFFVIAEEMTLGYIGLLSARSE